MTDPARIDPTNLFDVPDIEEDTESAFESLVGEGKKYRDQELLAKAALEKDRFIRQLEQETAALRSELQQRVTLEEFMDKVNSGKAIEDVARIESPPAERGVSPEDIENRVIQRLSDARDVERRHQNAKTVKEVLLQKLGKDYLRTLADKAEELGVNDKFLTELAQTQPKAFLSLFNAMPVGKPDVSFTPPSGISTERMPRASSEKTWSYFEKLRKENPVVYFSPKTQNDMHKEATRQGDAFYS